MSKIYLRFHRLKVGGEPEETTQGMEAGIWCGSRRPCVGGAENSLGWHRCVMRKYYSPKEISEMPLEDMFEAQPYYVPESTHAVHSLRYDWNGWPSGNAVFPETISSAVERCRDIGGS